MLSRTLTCPPGESNYTAGQIALTAPVRDESQPERRL